MDISTYIETCKDFAKTANEWGYLPQYRFFTTSKRAPYWEESCDNAHGGIPVDWAFRCPPEIIELEAPQKFVDALRDLLELAADTGEYPAAVAAVIDLMEN